MSLEVTAILVVNAPHSRTPSTCHGALTMPPHARSRANAATCRFIHSVHGISDGKVTFTFRDMRFLRGKFRSTSVKEGHETFDTLK